VRSTPLPLPYLGTSVMGQEELDLLAEVVRTQLPFREYGAGTPHMVKDFEREARAYFGMPYALATATGSGSFYCALAGLGVGPGDEVIIPSFGWFTNFEAPVILGATPVFADIDRSLNLDPDDVERKITPRTRAIIVVHFQGATNDMDRLLAIAARHGVAVVEDCAQACGATYHGRKVGSLADVSGFSFQQNKIMSTGDGGLLLARDARVFERAVRFHDLGFVRPSLDAQITEATGGKATEQPFSGLQFRMNEFTGAVALAQLRKLETAILGVTRRHFRRLMSVVTAECPGMVFRATGDPEGDAGIAFYMDMQTSERAVWFKKALEAEGIRVGPSSGCSNMLHTALVQGRRQVHPALPPFGPGWAGEHVTYGPELCPNTDRIVDAMVCVAITPRLSDADIDDIATGIIKVWHGQPKEIKI
jgi:8-amino-3,8-dideoxy-alpha-D-manno-octulosonate transaminase